MSSYEAGGGEPEPETDHCLRQHGQGATDPLINATIIILSLQYFCTMHAVPMTRLIEKTKWGVGVTTPFHLPPPPGPRDIISRSSQHRHSSIKGQLERIRRSISTTPVTYVQAWRQVGVGFSSSLDHICRYIYVYTRLFYIQQNCTACMGSPVHGETSFQIRTQYFDNNKKTAAVCQSFIHGK
jgi:hypothetical protein